MSKFNIFPNEILVLKSDLNAVAVHNLLVENTFKGSLSTSNSTGKKFIGTVNTNDFQIISSQSSKSVFCVINGVVSGENSSKVQINLRLHKGFRILFSVGIIFLASVLFIFPIPLSEKLNQLLMLLIFASVVRYFFISMVFNKVAEKGMHDLVTLLKMTETA